MLQVWFLLNLALVTVSANVIFEDCGSAYDLLAVNIQGCGMRLPCMVTLGEQIPVTMHFYAGFASRQLDHDAVFNINLINLGADVTPDPCDMNNCPVRTNAVTSFTSIMTVPTRMALNQRGFLRWRVLNESGRLVLCYSVLVQTQSASHVGDSIPISHPSLLKNATEGHLQELVGQYYSYRENHAD